MVCRVSCKEIPDGKNSGIGGDFRKYPTKGIRPLAEICWKWVTSANHCWAGLSQTCKKHMQDLQFAHVSTYHQMLTRRTKINMQAIHRELPIQQHAEFHLDQAGLEGWTLGRSNLILVGGIPTPCWDDDIPNIWKVIKFMFQTTNQNNMFKWLGGSIVSRL